MDLTESIAPKSDQLNAEDLLSGPRTFTIAEVKKGTDEQPVDVHLVEFPGRPFKPSKTVRRIMVAAWGVDSKTYAGQRMTLYRDPAVKFGGMDVGGIRVSHMTGIDKPLKIALTVSRGQRKPYVVQPLTEAAAPKAETPGPAAQMWTLFKETGHTEKDDMLAYISTALGRSVQTREDVAALTEQEIAAVVAELQLEKGPADVEQDALIP